VTEHVGDSTCLNVVVTSAEGFIVEGQSCLEYGQFFLDLMVFCVDVVVAHDFGVGHPVVQLVGCLRKHVELIPQGCEKVAKLQQYGLSCG